MVRRETTYLFDGAFRRLAWIERGPPDAPIVVCVHGLTRNSRDFDPLAEVLAATHRVIAVDLPGRGGSEWLGDPARYGMPAYVAALAHLLAVLGGPVGWVGTSLGGMCGMAVAALPGNPIDRLVLNDIGPFIPAAALARIRDYMGGPPVRFESVAAVEAHLRRVHAPFGTLDDAQWAHLARHSHRALVGGGFALHYDPAIAAAVAAIPPADVDLWAQWERIAVPRLVLRGEHSDVLLPETMARMAAEGAAAVTVPDCGHAPALMDPAAIGAVRHFLLS